MRQAVQRHVCTGCWLGLLFDLPPPWGEGGVCKSLQPLVLGFLSEFLKKPGGINLARILGMH